MDKYRKNFIQFDGVVYYCFLCEEQFCGVQNFEKHIRWQNHRKSLKNRDYFPKFKKHFIYKIVNHFYCEVCNVAVSSNNAVTEHINSDGHKAMKSHPKILTKTIGKCDSGKFLPGDVVIINELKLKMFEWQSIIDNMCLICDIRVPDIQTHMKTKDHNIQLMNSELLIENEHYYRKIKNENYYCFSCKKVYSAQEFSDHWLSRENVEASNIVQSEEITSSESIENPTEMEGNVSQPHGQSVSHFQDLFNNMSAENNLATCRTCNAKVSVDFVSMLAHVTNHHPSGLEMNPTPNTSTSDMNVSAQENLYLPKDHGKQRRELAKYGKKHSMKLVFPANKGWCFICDVFVSAHMNNFEEHVKGTTHQGNLKLQGLVSSVSSIQTKSILECNLQHITRHKEFWVSNCWKIKVESLFLFFKIGDKHTKKVKCYACNELFLEGQERLHCSSQKHKTNFLAAKVVIKYEEKGHFIREIRPNYFHCGFCNKTAPFLNVMEDHCDNKKKHGQEQSQCNMTRSLTGTTTINTESDDVYLELLKYGFPE